MLPHEIKIGPKQTLGISWALTWRSILIALPISLLGSVFPWLISPLAQVVLLPIIFWGAVHWLLSGGRVGSQKVTLMEYAHYQELAATFSMNLSESIAESTAQK